MAEIVRVVDGDTVDVLIDLGFGIRMKERVRLYGVDTPEIRSLALREKKFGLLAKEYVEGILTVGSLVILDTKLDTTGKYGTVLGVFTPVAGGPTLNNLILTHRLGVAYYGQSKSDIRALHEENWDFLEANQAAGVL